MTKNVLVKNIGENTITHQDQELKGLRFEVIDDNIIVVSGDNESNIDSWIARVGGTIASDAKVQEVRNAISAASKNMGSFPFPGR